MPEETTVPTTAPAPKGQPTASPRDSLIAEIAAGSASRARYIAGRFPEKAADIDGFLAEFASTAAKAAAWRTVLQGMVK